MGFASRLTACCKSTALIVVVCLTLGVLVVFSIAGAPFVLGNELHGSWLVEPFGPHAQNMESLPRRCQFDLSDDLIHISTVLEDVVFVGSIFTCGPFQFEGATDVEKIRSGNAMWSWHGTCGTEFEACSLLVHRGRVILHGLRPGNLNVVTLVLSKSPKFTTWSDVLEHKGRFVVMIVVVIVLLKWAANVIDPSPSSKLKRMELQRRTHRELAQKRELAKKNLIGV